MEKTFKITVNFGYLTGSVLAFIVAYMTAQGTIQNHIHFAGALNELAFFIVSAGMGIISAIAAFSFTKSSTK